jgi:hypothetical protein
MTAKKNGLKALSPETARLLPGRRSSRRAVAAIESALALQLRGAIGLALSSKAVQPALR